MSSVLSRAKAGVRAVARRVAVRFFGLPHSEGTVDSPTPEVADDLTKLWLRNSRPFQRRPLVDPAGLVAISMTTHGARLRDVWVPIESIGRGGVLPGRIILWLDEGTAVPRRVRRMRRRGLEIRFTSAGARVHTKYWPYVSTQPLIRPLVTADDDIVYPESWLADILIGYRATPDLLLAYRAHVVGLDEDGFVPYAQWRSCDDDHPSYANFPTSVSGQLLPVALQQALLADGETWRELSPNSDDIWYHRTAVLHGIRTRHVLPGQRHWPFVPGSQQTGLNAENVWAGANDWQMATAHTPETVARVRADVDVTS